MEREGVATAGRTYAGRSAEQRREERRARLIESAIELYGSRGYRATPILDVCSRARVTPRHFYELFDGSEALLLAAYDQVIGEQGAAIATALAEAPDGLEQRARAGIAAAAGVWRDEGRARLIQQEILGVSPTVELRYIEVMEGFADLITSEIQRDGGSERPGEADRVAGRMLAGGLNQALFAWRTVAASPRQALDALVDEMARVFVAAARGRR